METFFPVLSVTGIASQRRITFAEWLGSILERRQ
jgi:hypothetical protein